MRTRIGVDLGGTKIEGVALGERGDVIARHRVATPAASYRGVMEALVSVVGELERNLGETCPVGIGMPGIISPVSGLVKNSNTIVLNGKPLNHDLQTLLQRPLKFENDANCFALSEALDGAGSAYRSVFGVIIGTGTGGGLVIDGQIVRGANAIAGEWGHNPLPWAEPEDVPATLCYCGKRGCLETYLSGAGLVAAFRQAGGEDASAATVAKRYESGEAVAGAAIGRYVSCLARGLASVINVVDPAAIVLGGGLSNIAALYAAVPAALERYVFSDTIETVVLPARYGDSSGVRGAAWLWPP